MDAAVKKSTKNARVRGRLPVKKSINMAVVGQKKTNFLAVFLVLILILVAVAAVGKFLVLDRLDEVEREQQKVRDLRNELSLANAKLDSFGELKNTYAHYTFSDMTSEELNRVERSDVVDLIERIVLPAAQLNSWNIRQNQLTLNVTLDTLQDTNLLAQILNDEDMVEFATVKNAVTNEIRREETSVEPSAAPSGENKGDTQPAETPGEEGESQELSAGDNGKTADNGEQKELLYNVTAQIIVYLTNVAKED
jgi:hypothetical protein